MNEKIGLIVDGDGDYAAFRRGFPTFKVLKTDGPRGETAAVHNILSGTRKQISILRAFRCIRILVVLDFERRRVTYKRFLNMLESAFGCVDWGIPVSVAVPNRMIENWYLADIEFLSRKKTFLKRNIKQKNYEGTDGKRELKKCFIKRITYSETRHGPQLFAIIRFNIARQNSSSFNHFLQVLQRPVRGN